MSYISRLVLRNTCSGRRLLSTTTTRFASSSSESFPEPLFPDPPNKPTTGFEVKSPLQWPVEDLKSKPIQESGLPSGYKNIEYEDLSTAPIGDYPRDIPRYFPQQRDPYSHWDPQYRREWGEVLPDDYNYMNMFGPGVEVDWVPPFKQFLGVVGVIGLVAWGINVWDPELHAFAVSRSSY